MKILLLEHPRDVRFERCNDIANTPLASCLLSGYIAAMLESKGHQVEIVEGFLDKLSYAEIKAQISELKPDLLGVHMVYHWNQDLRLYNLLAEVKREGFTPYINVYGYYPTFAFEEILSLCPSIDSVVIGEPELTFVELTQALSEKMVSEGRVYEEFAGLAQRNLEGEIIHRRRQLIEDLDCLPFPKRTEALYGIGEVNILGSRGCYGRCTFCYINPFYGNSSCWRARSPENIITEIDEIIKQKGIRDFYFTDPNFFGPGQKGQQRALQLAALLKARDIRFGIEARVNDIHEETTSALVEAGLKHILIGLESGKDESLKRLNKMTTVAQNERALRILRKYGIEPNVGFIMFELDSSLADIRVNFEFLKRNQLLCRLEVTVNVLYHHQIVLQGTTAYQKLKAEGRLEIDPNSDYEASTSYSNPQVESLAHILRQVTGCVFACLEDIWSGKVKVSEETQVKHHLINELLVESFEEALEYLETGVNFSDREIEKHISNFKNCLSEIINR